MPMEKRNEKDSRPTLMVFIKNPIKGKVKTRLAKDVGDEKALQIYLQLLEHTRQVAGSLPQVRKQVHYSHFIDDGDEWKTPLFEKKLQGGESLGERMGFGFEKAFIQSPSVVIIGSDCPKISKEILKEAFDALLQSDVVIGPTLDKGYYLLGMNHFHPQLFQEIPWSTEKVLPLTLEKCKASSLKVHLLPTLSDVDYLEDWQNFGWDF